MAQTTPRTYRERLDAAHALDRALKAKVAVAQTIARGIVPDDLSEGVSSPRDVATCLTRVMALLVDVSTLSSRVLTVAEDALSAVERERGDAPAA